MRKKTGRLRLLGVFIDRRHLLNFAQFKTFLGIDQKENSFKGVLGLVLSVKFPFFLLMISLNHVLHPPHEWNIHPPERVAFKDIYSITQFTNGTFGAADFL